MSDGYRLEWSLYDILTVKHASSFISVVTISDGRMMWQNPASTDLFGCHGGFNSELRPFEDGVNIIAKTPTLTIRSTTSLISSLDLMSPWAMDLRHSKLR